VVYVERVLLVRFRVNTVESIAVTPSVYVTVHVSEPHCAVVRLPVLVASESSQIKSLAASLTLYVKAGVANLVGLIFKESTKQGLVTMIVKSVVEKIAGQS
jgi:hypothetical protein